MKREVLLRVLLCRGVTCHGFFYYWITFERWHTCMIWTLVLVPRLLGAV